MKALSAESVAPAWRLWVLAIALAACASVVLVRLYAFQVLERERFRELADNEQVHSRIILPKRGAILDAGGRPLAISVYYDNLYVWGPSIKEPGRTVAALAPLLDLPESELRAKFDPDRRAEVLLRSRLPAELSARVQARILEQRLSGVYLRPTPNRNYPEGSLAAQVLGFVDIDARGLAGLEFSYDDELHGEAGRRVGAMDTAGQEIRVARREFVAPRDGADLVTTLDRYLQRVAEREIADAVAKNKAIGGKILIMEPTTGAILAAASWPTFNVSEPPRPEDAALQKPTIVTDAYEPGSVMKIVTMAAGIEEGVVSPDTVVSDPGSVLIDGVRISNWDGGGHGAINMREVLIHSSNVGSIFVSRRLGPDRFYRYLDLFGFGRPTDVRLPGEASGSYRTPEEPAWKPIDLATNSYGQGVAVTPLQMLSAVAALANDGVLMRPALVRELRRVDEVTPIAPVPVRRAVTSRTAEVMTDLLVSVWQQPALQSSRLPGYRVAAKTGTADFPSQSGYQQNRTYASQVGFGPALNPRWVMLVRLDAPEGLYGGAVAAPVFRNMAEELFTYLRIPPSEGGLGPGLGPGEGGRR